MAYDKFTTRIEKSLRLPLPIENVDYRPGLSRTFFEGDARKDSERQPVQRLARYNGDDTSKQDFVLKQPYYSGKILVGGAAISGSGSGREEQATWAIYDYAVVRVCSIKLL